MKTLLTIFTLVFTVMFSSTGFAYDPKTGIYVCKKMGKTNIYDDFASGIHLLNKHDRSASYQILLKTKPQVLKVLDLKNVKWKGSTFRREHHDALYRDGRHDQLDLYNSSDRKTDEVVLIYYKKNAYGTRKSFTATFELWNCDM
jgi:hypothetical protein